MIAIIGEKSRWADAGQEEHPNYRERFEKGHPGRLRRIE
jgi:hypothetical protein